MDVSGRWVGTWDRASNAGGFIITLQQTGPKVIGDISLSGWNAGPLNGPVEGTVRGDVLRFNRLDGQLQGELTVAGDEMSGRGTWGAYGAHTLKLWRQLGSPPESR